MLRGFFVAAGLAVALFATTAGLGFATPAEEECEAAGGTYFFFRGDATCTFVEETNPGNPQSGNASTPFTETDSETQPGQGGGGGETSDNNQNFEEVDGPTQNPAGNVPPGQN
jgi:hypothetical protein